MTTPDVKRKLTAILSADVKGYSRLMGDDEVSTVRTLTAYREMMATLIQGHQGRVVDSPGDNLLAEFGSAVYAVACAVEIQRELEAKNNELSESRRMRFRIGVNLGDVIEEGERIYGDGVNIAARVEGLAKGGGICISGTVYDQIENKLILGYEYLGEHLVKNIVKPIRVYQVQMEPGAADSRPLASEKRMAFPLPEKPSIAVLPFVNMSGDPQQEYLSDGMTENITAALACISEMFVIARTSVFVYKGKPVKVQQVSEELGVRYVLEGSIQKMDRRLRVTAQLIDATTGRHRWAKRYDRDMKDLFAIQDEITQKIVVELEVQLIHGEACRARARTPNLEAWEYAARAVSLYLSFSKEDNAKAQALYENAVKLDPGYAFAWTGLGWCHFMDGQFGFSASRAQSFKQAGHLAQKALELDDTEPLVHGLLAHLHLVQRQYDQAISEGERAIALSPNNAGMHIILAGVMGYAGRVDDAIELAEKAMRLSPYYPAFYLAVLGRSYRMAGRHQEALAAYDELLNRSRKGEFPPLLGLLGLAAMYADRGQEERARAYTKKLLEIYPKFSLEDYSKMTFYKDPAHLQQALDLLRKAGLN